VLASERVAVLEEQLSLSFLNLLAREDLEGALQLECAERKYAESSIKLQKSKEETIRKNMEANLLHCQKALENQRLLGEAKNDLASAAIAASMEMAKSELYETQEKHKNELKRLNEEALERNERYEVDLKAHKAALEMASASHADQLKAEKESHTSALEALKSSHNEALEIKMAEHIEALGNLRKSHAVEVESLLATHSKALADALDAERAKLSTAHAIALEMERANHSVALAAALQLEREQHAEAQRLAIANAFADIPAAIAARATELKQLQQHLPLPQGDSQDGVLSIEHFSPQPMESRLTKKASKPKRPPPPPPPSSHPKPESSLPPPASSPVVVVPTPVQLAPSTTSIPTPTPSPPLKPSAEGKKRGRKTGKGEVNKENLREPAPKKAKVKNYLPPPSSISNETSPHISAAPVVGAQKGTKKLRRIVQKSKGEPRLPAATSLDTSGEFDCVEEAVNATAHHDACVGGVPEGGVKVREKKARKGGRVLVLEEEEDTAVCVGGVSSQILPEGSSSENAEIDCPASVAISVHRAGRFGLSNASKPVGNTMKAADGEDDSSTCASSSGFFTAPALLPRSSNQPAVTAQRASATICSSSGSGISTAAAFSRPLAFAAPAFTSGALSTFGFKVPALKKQ